MATVGTGSRATEGDATGVGGLPRWLRLALVFTAAFALAFGVARLGRAEAGVASAKSHMPAHASPAEGEPIA
jgi:hypothetical protein